MTRRLRATGAAMLLFVPSAFARYSNLIATADGKTLYFQADTGLLGGSWYTSRIDGSFASVAREISDINSQATVIAFSRYAGRLCWFGGSTCFLAAPCSAEYGVSGLDIDIASPRSSAFIRLDRSGKLAWIVQNATCPDVSNPDPGLGLDGLYHLPSLRLVAGAGGATLANQRHGRRLVTDRGRALAFDGIQMVWVDGSGHHPVRHVAGAFEAVTDARGDNIVYVEASVGRLHWIATMDEDLNFDGSAPALSDDGRDLFYLSPAGTLNVYDREARQSRRLGNGTYLEFTLGGGTVFAVTTENRLVRIDGSTGDTVTVAEAFPEVQSVAASDVWRCPLVCYGARHWFDIGPGMMLLFQGRYLDQPGWRARSSGLDIGWHSNSGDTAWIQVPSDLPRTSSSYSPDTLEILSPQHFLRISVDVHVRDRALACFGTVHEDFSRPVTPADPAVPGEIVHTFLTGLHGVETIPDGIPNPVDRLIPVADPPELNDPGMAEPLFLGLAPGLIAIQQLDMRMLRPTASPIVSLFAAGGYNCTPPAVAMWQQGGNSARRQDKPGL